ncbi:MAG: threonylcarbamoyl-AMP synthase [Nitrospirae bacterium]|nr:threonylcarbamoyl-AMP synthase [Nitrospirota bacterium]
MFNAVETLKKGGIIAYPTETFYGLGVKFDIEDSLKRLFEIKKRPEEKAIPLIIGNKELLHTLTSSINNKAMVLINRFWPGPLTLIFSARDNLSDYITAGTCTIAVRIPGESFALQLAKAAGFPITATSANPSGMPPALNVETVTKYFGDKIDLIIDGGHSPGGSPSTIVDVTGDDIKIVREGTIDRKQIATIA